MLNRVKSFKRKYFRAISSIKKERYIKNLLKSFCLENKSILDIGSSNSPYQKYLPKHKNYFNIDIDLSLPIAAVMSAEQLAINKNCIDLVIATDLLEHLKDPIKSINEIKYILREDGFVLITVPFLFKIHENPFDYWRFTEITLKMILLKDFEILEFKKIGGAFWVIWEVLLQSKIFQILRPLNFILSFFKMDSYNYPIVYIILCRRLKKNESSNFIDS